MAWYETCACCHRIHSPGKFTAVYIGARYFCKPSCSNKFYAETTLSTGKRKVARQV